MKSLALFCLLLTSSAYAKLVHESELATVKTGGNSEVQTINTKTTNILEWTSSKTTLGGHYIYGESKESVSARNWDVNGKYERVLDSNLSAFVGEVIEGNSFTGIKTRYNSDIGIKYYYIKSDIKNFFTELSYRYAIEDRYAPVENAYDNKGRFYNEYGQKVSETLQYKFWLEYIPNFTEHRDYLVNGEASLTSILTSLFSLKVAYLGMYDNRPAFAALKNYDYIYSTSLVAKF